jgi:hypothetical protein
MPLPYDTNALIKQTQDMLAQTKAQGSTSFAGSSYDTTRTGAVPVITPGSMTPATPITTTPTPVTPVPDVSTLQSQIDAINAQYAAPLPNEGNIKTLQQRVMDLSGQTNQEDVRRAQLEADPALQAKRQQVQDLTAQADALVAESKAIPIRIQQEFAGQGVTAGGVAPIQTAQLRNNAIQALSVGSLLSASQGNLSLALDQVDRAVKAEFEPKKAELKTARENLDMLMNDPAISREEKRRADIASATLNWQEAQQAKQEAERKSTLDLAAKLGAYGVDSSILKQIQSAKTFDEAFAFAAPYMQDPKVRLDLENSRLDNILANENILTARKQRELLGAAESKAEEKSRLAEEKAAKDLSTQAKAQLPSLNAKIDTLKGIATHKGLDGSVGAYALTRFTPISADKGERQDFKATIHQLTSELTLDNLINAKAKGATFGALSEGELSLLAKSASKLNDWEVKDEKGQGTGVWEIDEDSFLAEIKKIQEFAELDKAKKLGLTYTPDEKSILDEVFSTPSSGEISNFNPGLFFSTPNKL